MVDDDFLGGLGLAVEGVDGAVKVAGDDGVSLLARREGDAIGLSGIEHGRLVGFECSGLDFSFGESENDLVGSFARPGHAGDGGGRRELVADRLLLAPLDSDFVDEYDIVGLGESDLLGIRGEFHRSDNVAFLTLEY